MTYLVYKHTSPSGKAYIGLTQNLEGRNVNHRNPNSKCKAFYAAIKKYGWDNFTHEILQDGILSLTEAQAAEVCMIESHGTLWPNGYNLTAGGEGVEQSNASREARRTAWAMRSPEYREAIFLKVKATKEADPTLQARAAEKRLEKHSSKTQAEKDAIKAKRAATRAAWTPEQKEAHRLKLVQASLDREARKRQLIQLRER